MNSPTGQTSLKPGVEIYQQPGVAGSQLTFQVISFLTIRDRTAKPSPA